jgi:hypothetical protein
MTTESLKIGQIKFITFNPGQAVDMTISRIDIGD